jgi:hypothetical protein
VHPRRRYRLPLGSQDGVRRQADGAEALGDLVGGAGVEILAPQLDLDLNVVLEPGRGDRLLCFGRLESMRDLVPPRVQRKRSPEVKKLETT